MMKSIVIVLLLAIVAAIAITTTETIKVPLVKNTNGTDDVYYQATFTPNGSLAVGAWADYSVDISKDAGSKGGLSVLDSNNSSASNIFIYVRKGAMATASDNLDYLNQTCDTPVGQSCTFYTAAGVCNPKGTYHISVYNAGTTPIAYQFTVEIDDFGGQIIACKALSWIEKIIKDALIIFILVIVGIVVAIVGCLALCCYCCCRRSQHHHHHHGHSYQPIQNH